MGCGMRIGTVINGEYAKGGGSWRLFNVVTPSLCQTMINADGHLFGKTGGTSFFPLYSHSLPANYSIVSKPKETSTSRQNTD